MGPMARPHSKIVEKHRIIFSSQALWFGMFFLWDNLQAKYFQTDQLVA
jgi:hypothetical protein